MNNFSRCTRPLCWILFALTLWSGCKVGGILNIEKPKPPAVSKGPTKTSPVRVRRPSTGTELRGVWIANVDSQVLLSQAGIDAAFKRISDLKMNTVYPVVYNKNVTLYPSKVTQTTFGVKMASDKEYQNRDMLQEAVDAGMKHDLNVIAWLEYGNTVLPNTELAKSKPEWLLKKADGGILDKDNRAFLNPMHPEVQDYLVSLVSEIATNYKVDGVQLDDHFAFPVEFGYDDTTVQLYKQENNGKSPPNDIKNAGWMAWRASKLTALLKKMRDAVKSANSKALFSVSPNPFEFAYGNHLQDCKSWVSDGIVDELVIQIYRYDAKSLASELSKSNLETAKASVPISIGLIAGVKRGAQPPPSIGQIESQIETVRLKGFSGVSFFFYDSMFEGPDSEEDRVQGFTRKFATLTKAP